MNYLKLINEKKPLIHHITNWVTIFDCAQVTRNTGALPIMAHEQVEVAEMTNIASALVLNIGTLTKPVVESMFISGRKANEKNIPIILDIVGCGATKYRTDTVLKLVNDLKISIVKGNAGEIATLAGLEAEVRGVESMGVKGDIKKSAQELAKELNCTIVITGAEDIVASKDKVETLKVGDAIMGTVVGTGCMSASVLGSFASVADDYFDSSIAAMTFYGQAGERAASSKTPLEFKDKFLDEIYKTAVINN